VLGWPQQMAPSSFGYGSLMRPVVALPHQVNLVHLDVTFGKVV
jgi:hypothetical protein